MDFNFISVETFEKWDFRSPDTTGIGGSETSHIEVSERLKLRGHNVRSYAPVPYPEGSMAVSPAGVYWSDNLEADVDRAGIWVVYREPKVLEELPEGAISWLICQDIGYPHLTEARAARATRIVALCSEHAKYLKRSYPFTADKICISSNGIKDGLAQAILAQPPAKRNPKRLMYASSPDRGLWYLLGIFNRAKEIVPDLELHVYYGFDNIMRVIERKLPESAYAAEKKKQTEKLLNSPGVHHHGRVPQCQLLEEWTKAGIWCYPTAFPETSCITSMDAQAMGAIPITNPYWALKDNVKHGVFIEGNPQEDALVRARYVNELARLALDEERQEEVRREMQPWALKTFPWDRFVSQWERWARQDLGVKQDLGARAETGTRSTLQEAVA